MTKATDMGIPFYYVNKNRENQLYGIYAITSGNHGVDLVPSQSVKNARMESENHRKTVDVFLTLHYQCFVSKRIARSFCKQRDK